jgi:hypothetical protein
MISQIEVSSLDVENEYRRASALDATIGNRFELNVNAIELEYGLVIAGPTETPIETPVKPDTAPATPTKPEEPPFEPSEPRPGRTCPTREPGTLPVCEATAVDIVITKNNVT